MYKTWLVFKNEFITTVLRPSFLLALFGIPLMGAIIMGVVGTVNKNQPDMVSQLLNAPADTHPIGLVDLSGLITQIPDGMNYVRYANEDQARQDVLNGSLSGAYVIAADYLKTGHLTSIRADFNPISAIDHTDSIQQVIDQNLLGNDVRLTARYEQPMKIDTVNLNPNPEQAQESEAGMFVPTGITMVFYIMLVTASSMLMNSISREKENRVMEILMSSIDARQILIGKITALALVGLLQLAVWMGGGMFLLGTGRQANLISGNFYLPPNLLWWALIYFLGGYLIYASLMAGVGALAPNMREGSQMTSLIIMPMIIPLILMSNTIQAPDGTLSLVLSLIPFTSPISMITRMSVTEVPLWQSLLGLALVWAGAIWVLRMVAAMFRSQVILAGQPFTRQRFFKVLLGKLD
jgi:ABC-2 type transport system permease protein